MSQWRHEATSSEQKTIKWVRKFHFSGENFETSQGLEDSNSSPRETDGLNSSVFRLIRKGH